MGYQGDASVPALLHLANDRSYEGDASVPTLLHTTPAPTRSGVENTVCVASHPLFSKFVSCGKQYW